MWGLFLTDDPQVIHVAPCDKYGDLRSDHLLSRKCPCSTRIELSEHDVTVVIHEEIQ
jgi:hypothetical protein